ncbi:MAG: ATP-binding cassette domain-containing protein [Thermodesulfobacteriota bacterium]|nr:ATP-binding cassette domain-containing protein [Thermodesulfobacteriota bacterium]
MIQVENLTKYYGHIPAIKGVTFTVEKGEILGFLGPNGAGKTTTMRILSCFMPATEGTAKVAGYDVFEDSLEVRKRIGYQPENVPLYKDMPVLAYLNFVAEVRGVERRERKAKVDKVMDECGIREVSGKLIGNLSKGYRQRVGIAQALVHDPEILILDEPTIGLDPRQIHGIRGLIKNLAGERTIILSTHILPEVSMTCQRVIIINEGELVAVDSPENLTARLQKATQTFIEVEGPSDSVIQELQSIQGVTNVEKKDSRSDNTSTYSVDSTVGKDIRRELFKTIANKGWILTEMRQMGMSLEDIFIKLVTEEKH